MASRSGGSRLMPTQGHTPPNPPPSLQTQPLSKNVTNQSNRQQTSGMTNFSFDAVMDTLVVNVQSKLRQATPGPGSAGDEMTPNMNLPCTFINSRLGHIESSAPSDLWKSKLDFREATMYQEDLLDPEIVQIQTFKKARPESGWVSVMLNAAIRAIFLPFSYKWWNLELLPYQFLMLFLAWVIAAWNLQQYFYRPVVKPASQSKSNNQFIVLDVELVTPAVYLFLIAFLYSHIANARKRHTATGAAGSAPPRRVPKVSEKTSVYTRTAHFRAASRRDLETQSADSSFTYFGQPRQAGDSYLNLRQPPVLSPIGDIENETVEANNHEDANSVSSQEEHCQQPEPRVPNSGYPDNARYIFASQNYIYRSTERELPLTTPEYASSMAQTTDSDNIEIPYGSSMFSESEVFEANLATIPANSGPTPSTVNSQQYVTSIPGSSLNSLSATATEVSETQTQGTTPIGELQPEVESLSDLIPPDTSGDPVNLDVSEENSDTVSFSTSREDNTLINNSFEVFQFVPGATSSMPNYDQVPKDVSRDKMSAQMNDVPKMYHGGVSKERRSPISRLHMQSQRSVAASAKKTGSGSGAQKRKRCSSYRNMSKAIDCLISSANSIKSPSSSYKSLTVWWGLVKSVLLLRIVYPIRRIVSRLRFFFSPLLSPEAPISQSTPSGAGLPAKGDQSSVPGAGAGAGGSSPGPGSVPDELSDEEEDDTGNMSSDDEDNEEETGASSLDGDENRSGDEMGHYNFGSNSNGTSVPPSRYGPNSGSANDTAPPFVSQMSMGGGGGGASGGLPGFSGTNVPTTDRTVTAIQWTGFRCSKYDMTADQVLDCIVNRSDAIKMSNSYLLFGFICAAVIAGTPLLHRAYFTPNFFQLNESSLLLHPELSSSLFYSDAVLSGFSFLSCLLSSATFFTLLAAAERTYLQRYYYSKYLYRLTSSRKARKCEIPHFRLTKVRNIRMWLYIRFKLKAHGPQKTVEVIVSNCLLFCIFSISFVCFKLLDEQNDAVSSAGGVDVFESTAGAGSQVPLTGDLGRHHRVSSWVAIAWFLGLGCFLLRFITIGTKVNKKYSNTAMLTTERINLSLRMEKKPDKREDYFLADRVLKLACRLISEVESPFKVSGLVMNSSLYNIMRVIVLSAVSAVMSELLGFKLKLWKI